MNVRPPNEEERTAAAAHATKIRELAARGNLTQLKFIVDVAGPNFDIDAVSVFRRLLVFASHADTPSPWTLPNSSNTVLSGAGAEGGLVLVVCHTTRKRMPHVQWIRKYVRLRTCPSQHSYKTHTFRLIILSLASWRTCAWFAAGSSDCRDRTFCSGRQWARRCLPLPHRSAWRPPGQAQGMAQPATVCRRRHAAAAGSRAAGARWCCAVPHGGVCGECQLHGIARRDAFDRSVPRRSFGCRQSPCCTGTEARREGPTAS